MKKILIAYSTFSGTTFEVARTVAEELKKADTYEVTLANISEKQNLQQYDAFVFGAPMIVGWQREMQQFLKKNQAALAQKPVALFATAMNLTQSGESAVEGVPVFVDEALAVKPVRPDRLTLKESYASITNYVKPMLRTTGSVKPISVALFGGRLDLYRLKIWAVLFVTLVIHAKPGEKRNWAAIRTWAGQMAEKF